ncbi:spore germination protein [Fictibacillus fluitans]|uniref:Spore germination protein n=1 Tax=Fictibacillus fluitans TaxID=3058422 RepID=A0ABT8HTH0_9BACL|nr:spore germination protein [Fictibacillus sp. NE201]MDN4524049.1 spore germination protein [Fictibacillus sp. NE201]
MKNQGSPPFNQEDFFTALSARLGHPPDLIKHTFLLGEKLWATCIFLHTLIDVKRIETFVFEHLMTEQKAEKSRQHGMSYFQKEIPMSDITFEQSYKDCADYLLLGNCLLFINGEAGFLVIEAEDIPERSIAEPQTEPSVRGPKDGFTENVMTNLSLVRSRLRTQEFRVVKSYIGSKSKTKLLLCYLNDTANMKVVKELQDKLEKIKIDSLLDSAYIEELITDKPFNPFPVFLNTERPDVAVSHLTEGRVVLLTEGTPVCIIAPVTFFQFFNAVEDYYQKAVISSLMRMLRILAFMLAVFIPSLYIAITTYHQAILPTNLLISLSAQREGVPFPAFVEAMLMMIVFEIIREAGIRMPRVAGQAISIVGALVLGQAAVEAGLVSPAMVIVVSLTAISNFVSPSYSFSSVQRLLQYGYMCLGAFMGLFGILCGVLYTLLYLVSLESFGTPYFAPVTPLSFKDLKDTVIRVPWPWLKKLPSMNHLQRKRR